jgi:hypothetical protein
MPRLHDRIRPADLAMRWRSKAEDLRRLAAEAQAVTLEHCADELEEALRETEAVPLNLQQAAEQSGYSPDHLGRLIREGKIPNAGRSGAPKILRRDLPRKAAALTPEPSLHELPRTKEQIVRSVIAEGG